MVTKKEREEYKQKEAMAISFVNEIQEQFTIPIINNIEKFLDTQEFTDEVKYDLKKTLMITIANSIIMKSGARKKEIKQAYKGLIADYEKLN